MSAPTICSRQVPRLRAMIGARAVFNPGGLTADCVIRDISDHGARLVFCAPMTMPDRFDLVIAQRGVTRRAQAVWWREREIGVRFEEAPQPRPSSVSNTTALIERIRELEAEVARLESRIYRLTEGA